jgi:hypothetical protein
MLFQIAFTAMAAAAVWWMVFRLPGFWRRPQPVNIFHRLALRRENQARALPAFAVLFTPLVVALATIGWVQSDDDPDGVVPWLQNVFSAYIVLSFVAFIVIATSGRPRIALPPSLRGSDYREVALHYTTVHELVGGGETPFYATCACGWDSDHHATEAAARAEATKHSHHVMAGLDRIGESHPVG